jgi:SpoVK/Ycf46/Vps4 family AAA+-type ATPase
VAQRLLRIVDPRPFEGIASQFSMSLPEIRSVTLEVLARSRAPHQDLTTAAWQACRARSRSKLDGLAQRIEPAAAWDDLVLPAPQVGLLRQLAMHVRQRATVFDRWGFGAKSSRGKGITALFSGASGTGKTMAAEVLAGELQLDLYRVDLSAVVNKYIGETEKNLRRVFDAAEQDGAVLLFDEADALFGKRSEVKDSHDRYSNIEVSYLLQRMEEYRGLAILTTNMKSALDTAFLRRIRFIVQFPFPDVAQRAEIWRRVFPDGTPTETLEIGKLSRLNVAGGNIRNIAINAAFLAADAGERVCMRHLLHAVHTEYAKLQKTPTDAEIGSWL